LPEYEKALREGTWWTKLLEKAARRLRDIYGEEVFDAWRVAYRFHQEGFHEERFTVDEVLEEAFKIEKLIKIVEKEFTVS